jgi:nicotinamide-nucleotide amidase
VTISPRIRPLASVLSSQQGVNCFDWENRAEELLGDVTVCGRDLEVGITVHEATITLRIVASALPLRLDKIAATKTII